MSKETVTLEWDTKFYEYLQKAAQYEKRDLGEYIHRACAVAVDVTTHKYIEFLEQRVAELEQREDELLKAALETSPPLAIDTDGGDSV